MLTVTPVAHIENDFPDKFGIPRQGALTKTVSRVVLEKDFAFPEALRGIEGFSHLWLIWVFSENAGAGWHPTVRPPKLGGNTRVGVFATRSPFRPNPIGLSCVKLEAVEGTSLIVSGADLMNGTPILDIKPYLPYADSVPEALSGFAPAHEEISLTVADPENCLSAYPVEKRPGALALLEDDPRPGYRHEADRIFGVSYAGRNIRFTVAEGTLTVLSCEPLE